MAKTLCRRNSSSSGKEVDGVMMVYGCDDVRLNLLMCLITRSSYPSEQDTYAVSLTSAQAELAGGRTGEACPASHFSFSAATSRYPSGFRWRSKTLSESH